MIQEIKNANAQGIKTGGLLPISMYPAKKMIDRTLTLIQEGMMDKASNALNSNVHIMEAFIRALNGFDGSRIPVDMHKDWNERAEFIIMDLKLAAECKVTQALL